MTAKKENITGGRTSFTYTMSVRTLERAGNSGGELVPTGGFEVECDFELDHVNAGNSTAEAVDAVFETFGRKVGAALHRAAAAVTPANDVGVSSDFTEEDHLLAGAAARASLGAEDADLFTEWFGASIAAHTDIEARTTFARNRGYSLDQLNKKLEGFRDLINAKLCKLAENRQVA